MCDDCAAESRRALQRGSVLKDMDDANAPEFIDIRSGEVMAMAFVICLFALMVGVAIGVLIRGVL